MRVCDLFCGAGGTSLGARQAGAKVRFALNHWDVAVATHSANFPEAKHVNSRLDECRPSECGTIDLLFASPECTHHSRARGSKPTSDQQRAGAWDIMPWLEFHRPAYMVIENVREFEDWGPTRRRRDAAGRLLRLPNGEPWWEPDPTRQGQIFQAWVKAIQAHGYRVEYRTLNAADFGAATSRQRLFVIARKGSRLPLWPEPTHARRVGGELPGMGLERWMPASGVIDWSIELPSVFARKTPLRDKTLARIEAGLRRFVGPFVATMRGTGDVSSTATSPDGPLGTITAGGRHHAVAVPFGVQTSHTGTTGMARYDLDVDEPLRTVGTRQEFGLALPLMSSTCGGGIYQPAESGPCPTIRCRNGALLAVPFMVPHYGERDGQLPRTHSFGNPMPTICCDNSPQVCLPFLADVNHGGEDPRVSSIHGPIGTVTQKRGVSVAAPLVLSYYSNGSAKPVVDPLATITTNDRFAVMLAAASVHDFTGRTDGERSLLAVMWELGVIDIGFRMLANHELSNAQGFTVDYIFHGNKSDVTRQIGNSVSPPVAKAITNALVG